jgi:hypothetical protein
MEPAALEELRKQAIEEDTVYLTALQCVRGGERCFPTYLELKASIAECYADNNSVLHFRNRKWVPNSEPPRTRLIHEIHTLPATGVRYKGERRFGKAPCLRVSDTKKNQAVHRNQGQLK